MSDKISFTLNGLPKGKGRPRAFASIVDGLTGPQAIVQMVTPQETRDAEAAIADYFRKKFPGHKPWTGAVLLRFTAIFPIPQAFTNAQRQAALSGKLYHTSKPDKDNIEKLVADALNGLAWADDSQVQGGGVKRYGTNPRVEVTLEHLPAPDGVVAPAQKRRDAKAAQPMLDLAPRKPKKKRPDVPAAQLEKYPPKLRAMIDAALEREKGN